MEKRSQLKFNSDGSINIPENVRKDLVKQKTEMLDIWDEGDFSDEKFHLDDDVAGFNLYRDGVKLAPLMFSNGKTQEDIVNEIKQSVEAGNKVIFIRGVCGTGKSAIALNLAKALKSASIVVPGKALQKQYYEDYTNKNYVLKDDHKKLKIKVISGRQNHKCLYSLGKSADDFELPCKIEIKEANMAKLKEYLKENHRVKDDLGLKEIRRVSVAPVCPYWSPIIPSEYDIPMKSDKKKYPGLNGIEFTIHNRKSGCRYYNQFNSYVDAEAIIFNSAKYKLESAMNRKPGTSVEIIDECDEFLDSFSNIRRINLNRFFNSLNTTFFEDEKADFILQKVRNLVSSMLKSSEISDLTASGEINYLHETDVVDLFNYFLENPEFVNELDEDSYVNNVYEVVKDFEHFIDESFVNFSQEERGLYVNVVTTNLEKKFRELLDKNNVLVLMSGTLHDENVLKSVYGIEGFDVIDAEIVSQGSIEGVKTGMEIDCKYSNFQNGRHSRKDYLVALNECVEKAVKPVLVHVNAFSDLPSEEEKFSFGLDNLMTKSKMLSLQGDAELNVKRFKKGEVPVLFTTRCGRGVDFPGEQCRSIVFTKYPNPHVQNLFWKILQKTHPQWYWGFYRDKARREFLQKIYRGVRSEDDHVFVLSPDSRIFDELGKIV
ncbi:hypothetical protein CMI46_01860 [Candidatus Pacearchaeota archaeon]|nr:hypothetical protein [Candidatus Pacearchaeota archaeon]